MSDLVRTLTVCGLLSGTQPITLMGLLLVLGGARPRANGFAFLGGAFIVQAGLLLGASALFGGSVSPDSEPGRVFVGVRVLVGLVLVGVGVLLRRPPGKPIPEIPHALERLREMGPRQSFVAGVVVADYQGPVLASFALASSSLAFGGRLVGLGVYALIATGLPLVLMVWTTASERARDRVTRTTTWIMRNRRVLASWFALAAGCLLVLDGIVTFATS
ncbi:MAG: GAP family protein [Acidimicrobiia bacterium]